MRAHLIPILACLLIGSGATLLVIWLRDRMRKGPGSAAVEQVLNSRGAARCLAASRLLRDLERAGDESATRQAWDAIEMPLLEALPDCPPDYKVELIAALDAIARRVSGRELAKRIMTMRNSLIA